jgi:CBS domain containing-hemolysin-like protein
MGIDAVLLIFYISLALGVSFICSIAEASLLSMTPSYIASLKENKPKTAERLKRLRETDLDRSIAAILTVNTIAHTLGAIGAGAKATAVFGEAWFGVFSAIMTLLILYVSEIVPKTLGAVHWKALSGFTYAAVAIMVKVVYPLIFVSEGLTRLLAGNKKENHVNRDEFAAMANIGEELGILNDRESQIIKNLLELRTVKAIDVMTPRIVMFTLNKSMTVRDALKAETHTHFSRIPIYENEKDHLVGFVLRDDLLHAHSREEGDLLIESFCRELITVADSAPLAAVMDLFLQRRQHIAVVVNEYGETKGLVTLEDVMETLLGEEIMDEGDKVADLQQMARKRWERRARKMGISMPVHVERSTLD